MQTLARLFQCINGPWATCGCDCDFLKCRPCPPPKLTLRTANRTSRLRASPPSIIPPPAPTTHRAARPLSDRAQLAPGSSGTPIHPHQRPKPLSPFLCAALTRRLHHSFSPSIQQAPCRRSSPVMDVVLEAFDTYLFDYIYAFAVPSPVAHLGKTAASNGTYSAIPEMPSPAQTWQFEPASQYLSFPPTEYAWMSSWMRDNIYRQATSLFLITWYAPTSNWMRLSSY